jgi:Astacin (Peptidase family M12A)
MNLTVFSAEDQLNYIRKAMDKVEEVSCLKFVPFDSKKHEDYVIVSGEEDGCFSEVGRQGKLQFKIIL